MKSYKSHLIDTKSYGEHLNSDYRPVMRSSAAFPLIHRPKKLTSFYTFMGYWLRKRKINLVTVLATIRSADGKKIALKSIEVDSIRSYLISSSDILEDPSLDFIGSIEIEVFSAVDMVFPYPAITFGIKGTNGLTFVHTCGRIYNDFEDMKSNSEQQVPETGFDIYNGESFSPFFSFVNGPLAIQNKHIELEYYDINGFKISKKQKIKDVEPYGLGWIELNEEENNIDNKNIFRTCVKIKHDFKGFFPRFVAGNVLRDYEDISLTHSYYDTSVDKSKDAIWKNPSSKDFYDSVVSVPFDSYFSDIELAVYPNFVYAPTNLIFELYSSNGEFIDKSEKILEVANYDEKLLHISLHKIFSSHKNNIVNGMVKIICNAVGQIPARMKFGLNFIRSKDKTNLPSNICFNAHVANEKLLKKSNSFLWCPIFAPSNQKIFLHNTSFTKYKYNDAEINIEVYRERDNEILEWNIQIPYNGTTEIIGPMTEKIIEFLEKDSGWVSFSCNSPFIKGFYITDFDKGVIGADHLY